MDTPHEFWASQDPIDVNLYADLIVAIWRFDNLGAVRDVFPICLALERSDAVKATAVRALLTIISEVGSIPKQLRKCLLTSNLIVQSASGLSISHPSSHCTSRSDRSCVRSIKSVHSGPEANRVAHIAYSISSPVSQWTPEIFKVVRFCQQQRNMAMTTSRTLSCCYLLFLRSSDLTRLSILWRLKAPPTQSVSGRPAFSFPHTWNPLYTCLLQGHSILLPPTSWTW